MISASTRIPEDPAPRGDSPDTVPTASAGDRRGRRPLSPLTAGVVAVGLLASCAGAATPQHSMRVAASGSALVADAALRPFYEQKIAWADCGEGIQCGRIAVPLDYADPGKTAINVAVTRKAATDRKNRIGSLLVNPGGPGGSGADLARTADSAFSARLRARYDIVGFDPRGVGESSAIRCLPAGYAPPDMTPDDPTEMSALADYTKKFTAACQANSGTLLAHVSTREVARDMDVLRAVLGDAKLHYFGFSYGTYLGAVYAELFPHRVGRMALDGAVDPRIWLSPNTVRSMSAGYEVALDAFLADCVESADCPLGTSTQAARQRVTDMLQRAGRAPLPGGIDDVGMVGFMVMTLNGGRQAWPLLRVVLGEALAGETKTLRDVLAELSKSGEGGNYTEAHMAIACLDSPPVASSAHEVTARVTSLRQTSPVFGEFWAWFWLPCSYWPAKAVSAPHAIKAAGTPPILVVGTTRDPAASYAEAQGLADQLASGVLLTYDGDGHAAYVKAGSTCVDNAVDTYLIEGRVVAKGTRCS